MTDDFKPDFLSYDDIRRVAEEFLGAHCPDRSLPIEIEEVVEFHMGINIVPVPDMKAAHGVDGCTSGDCKDILVDQSVYDGVSNRYRFTLAHEVGHIVLHRKFYEGRTYYGAGAWCDRQAELKGDNLRWFEYQANSFAGLILMPSPEFNDVYQAKLDGVMVGLGGEGGDRADLSMLEAVAEEVGSIFGTSADATSWRARYEFGSR